MELSRSLLVAVLAAAAGAPGGGGPTRDPALGGSPLPAALSRVAFEENRGQTDPGVRFLARARGLTAFLTDDGAVLSLGGPRAPRETATLRFGAGLRARPVAEGTALPGPAHYLLGRDPSKWVRGVPRFPAVRAAAVAPGTDLLWRDGEGGRLRFDLHLAPGADPATVPLAIEGARTLAVDGTGRLVASLSRGTLALSRPRLWQERAGRRIPVDGRWVLRGGAAVVEAGPRDPGLPLVVDPTLDYGTYLGGGAGEGATAVATDAQGGLVIVGTANGAGFPTQNPYDDSYQGSYGDMVVARISANGATLQYATYVGGGSLDVPRAVAVAADGHIAVCGESSSTDFPTLNAVQETPVIGPPVGLGLHGVAEGAAFLLSADGFALEWSTYLGGSQAHDGAHGIALDASLNAFVAGETGNASFPTQSAFQGTKGAGQDAFVCRIGATGALGWSTFLGGGGNDGARALRIDSGGGLLVAGTTASTDFPLQSAYQNQRRGPSDAFVLRMPSTGASLTWSTYVGGSGTETAKAVAEGPGGVTWIAGETGSSDFPVVANAPQPNFMQGNTDAFVARVGAGGTTLPFGSYLGGGFGDGATGIAVDALGAVYVAGTTGSSDFPVVNAYDSVRSGSTDMFLARFRPSGIGLLTCTFFGGGGDDLCEGMALDAGGGVWLAGLTASPDFPLAGAYDGVLAGLTDVAIARLRTDLPAAPGDLQVSLGEPGTASVSWTDGTGGLCPHEVERQAGSGGPWIPLGTVAAGLAFVNDGSVPTEAVVTWRVRALDHPGPGAWGSTSPVTTPPFAPEAPSGLSAAALGPSSLRLSWTDNSAREDEVRIHRSEAGGEFALAATAPANATTFDVAARPDRTYRLYLVAANEGGASPSSNEAQAATPPSFVFGLRKGSLKYSVNPQSDSLKLKVAMLPPGEGAVPILNPAADGIEVHLGDRVGAPALSIAPGASGWKVKNTNYTWKSPRGAVPKVKVVVNGKKGTVAVALSLVDLPPVLSSALFTGIDCGPSHGSSAKLPWTQLRTPGWFKYP
jgi:hypothetical protein